MKHAVKPAQTGNDALNAQPLADRMRPARLEDIAGQTHLLAPGKPLRRAVESGVLHSMILWARRVAQDHAGAHCRRPSGRAFSEPVRRFLGSKRDPGGSR